jgi:hypothetical protein
MQSKPAALWIALSCTLTLAACVTINIYFPAAAAEKAADRIIDEVWQIKKGEDAAKGDKSAVPK